MCDARQLATLDAKQYDAIYCSHNLEHYYHHDAIQVLNGFMHVLKDDGFVHLRVPDMRAVMAAAISRNLDIEDALYKTNSGAPITVRDVIYGYGREIEISGNDFYAHKTGFTETSLRKLLHNIGFLKVYAGCGNLEITAFAFKSQPSEYTTKLLNLPN